MANPAIRLLREDEIECRAATVRQNGISILLYKDARVDQRILDETFGPFGWKRSHQSIDGNLYCTVEILDRETGEWVSKQDVGTTGYTEKEKSQASDSFKRACFNWGIGRELYSAPFIWVPAGKADIRQNGGKYSCNDHFSVGKISYNGDREIKELSIINERTGQTVYAFHDSRREDAAASQQDTRQKGSGMEPAGRQQAGQGAISPGQLEHFQAELQRTGVQMAAVRERFAVGKPEEMTEELYGKVMRALARTRTAA